MDLSYLADAFITLVLISAGVYFLLRFFFLKSVVCFTDPVNLALLLLAAYFSGALFIVQLIPINQSYINVLVLDFLFVFVAALVSRRPTLTGPMALKGQRSNHFYFTCCFTGLLLANLVVNQVFGVIPLFLGNEARRDLGTTAMPSLVLIAPDIGYVLLLIFLLTDSRDVKRASGLGLWIAGVSTILNGSKSAFFATTIGLLLSADYVLHLKRLGCSSQVDAYKISSRIKTIRRWIAVTAVPIILLMPYYLVLVKADADGGSSGAIEGFATRLFGGFDNLAFIAFNDLDITSAQDVSLLQFYFYPFYTRFFSTPDFQSAGQYVVYLATGDYDYSTYGLHPNSNFAIELLLQNGNVFISGAMIIAAASLLFIARGKLIAKGSLSILYIVFWTSIVMAPLTILFDGAYFVIKFYVLLAFYLVFNTVLNAFTWLRRNKAIYTFY